MMRGFESLCYEAQGAIHCRAPGKINLTLAVLGRRDDGFHEIESHVVTVGWYDHLAFRPADKLTLTLRGECGGLPGGSGNLALRAAEALAEASSSAVGAAIVLDKVLPVGAGLGGGSSDAAATLWALNRLWRLRWPPNRLAALGATIGSDVPLFFAAPACRVRGRGERVEPLEVGAVAWFVLIVPSFSMSTAEVYERWQPLAGLPEPERASAPSPMRDRRPRPAPCFNDLQAAALACEPRLASLHAALDGLSGRRVCLTGSGSGLFAQFDSRDAAAEWARQARARVPSDGRVVVVASLE